MDSDSFQTASFSGLRAWAIAGSVALLGISGGPTVAQSDLTRFDVKRYDDNGAFFLEHDALTPPMMFREGWQQPPADGPLNDENRRITPDALTNPDLEYRLYGPDASNIQVTSHNGIQDLWNGYTTSPVALTLRHKDAWMDLTGLSRMRWRTRTENLHALHAVVRLADGRLLVGSQRFESPQRRMIESDAFTGNFVVSEVTFDDQRWFELDPEQATVGFEVNNPDLSRVDEIGYVDLMPGGGHGTAGCTNVSWIEVYATPRAR